MLNVLDALELPEHAANVDASRPVATASAARRKPREVEIFIFNPSNWLDVVLSTRVDNKVTIATAGRPMSEKMLKCYQNVINAFLTFLEHLTHKLKEA
jgi:hypothetical protein